MNKFIPLLVVSAIGVSSVANADNDVCVQKSSQLSDFQENWPTLPIQETPGDQAFCATDGAVLMRTGNQGLLTKVLGLKFYGTNHWVPDSNNSNKGYYQADGFLQLNVDGFPVATIKYTLNNVLNGKKLCRLSSGTEAIGPNQTTLAYGPNIDMDLNKDTPNGRYIVDDRFIYGPINPQTNLIDTFTNIRNVNASTPGADQQMVEFYFNRAANKQDCELYNDYVAASQPAAQAPAGAKAKVNAAELPDLEADLSKVWTLEGGAKMTGAEIRKAVLGY